MTSLSGRAYDHQAAEALDEGDGAGLWCGEVAGARDAALPGGDGADDEAADPGGPGGVAGEPQTQRLGQGQEMRSVESMLGVATALPNIPRPAGVWFHPQRVIAVARLSLGYLGNAKEVLGEEADRQPDGTKRSK